VAQHRGHSQPGGSPPPHKGLPITSPLSSARASTRNSSRTSSSYSTQSTRSAQTRSSQTPSTRSAQPAGSNEYSPRDDSRSAPARRTGQADGTRTAARSQDRGTRSAQGSGRGDSTARSTQPRSAQPAQTGGAASTDRRFSRNGADDRRGPKARGSEAIQARQNLDRADKRAAVRRPTSVKSAVADLFASRPPAAADNRSFAELGVPAALLPVLAREGAVNPFPIQAATLVATMEGRDVLGRARTGSGKTLAFAIPLVTRLTGGRRVANRPRGLVLAPTRELALQIDRTVTPLAAAAGLRTTVIFGGVGYGGQTSAMRAGVDIVIACPGRLEDLVHTGAIDLSDVQLTVLDEADHMADLGFLPGVRRLLRATDPDGQRLLFSATLDNGIGVLVDEFLTDPAVFAVDEETSPVSELTHHVVAVSKDDRNEVVRRLAAGGDRRLLFTRTKHSARKWAETLRKSGITAVDLHGNLSQGARERNLAAFADGTATVLVATDIAARGIHVDDIALVVHVDPPTEHKAYLHRSGRTARAGAAGTVVTVMLPEQRADVTQLMRQAGIKPTISPVGPGSPILAQLAG
jgi:superfamily II DNA/RNA helicase